MDQLESHLVHAHVDDKKTLIQFEHLGPVSLSLEPAYSWSLMDRLGFEDLVPTLMEWLQEHFS